MDITLSLNADVDSQLCAKTDQSLRLCLAKQRLREYVVIYFLGSVCSQVEVSLLDPWVMIRGFGEPPYLVCLP